MHAADIDTPAPAPVAPPMPRSAAHDFDFLFGRWRVDNARLRQRLAGCGDWEHFEAISECRPVLGGIGNLDRFESGWQGGFQGLTLRLFDRSRQRWTIHWASDRSGALDAPMSGGFEDGIGRFFGTDRCGEASVLSRFLWTTQGTAQATWEQAFSDDGGRQWETNWIMRFTRIAA